jgi:hypothetical protein
VLLPFLGAALWAVGLAPRSAGRLSYPTRLVAKLALVLAAAALLGASGALIWAIVFLVVAGALFTAGERRERPIATNHVHAR